MALPIPAHGMRRIAYVPQPSGFRFYHTHVVPMNNLSLGTYTGQAGPVYIEPAHNSGAYDHEVFLVLKGVSAVLQPGRRCGNGFFGWRADQGIARYR